MRGNSVVTGNTVLVAATEANYGGPSIWKGSKFTAASGTTTTHDLELTEKIKLFSGTYFIGPTAVLGDRIEFEVYDKNGVLGPADTSIRKYVENLHVVPSERRTLSNGQASTIPQGLFLRTTYYSTGSAPVEVLLDWLWFRIE